MKMIFRIAYITFFSAIFHFGVNAQMSVFNKLTYLNGEYASSVPKGDNIMVFSGEKKVLKNRANLRITRFDECRNVDWSRAYKTENKKVGTGYPLVLNDFSDNSYVLLKGTEDNNNVLTLVKTNTGAQILWSKTFDSKDLDLSNYDCNLLFSEDKKYLYIVANAKGDKTVIFSLNNDGTILESKVIDDINHASSVIDADGNLFIFSNNQDYAKVDIDEYKIDSLFWVKSLSNLKFNFDKVVNPISINSDNPAIVTAIINEGLEPTDPYLYKLVKFDLDGVVLEETAGYPSVQNEVSKYNNLKLFEANSEYSIFYMLKNKVLFFDSKLSEIMPPKVYLFNEQEYFVADASLELCKDNSLVMAGHCYTLKDDNSLDTLYPYLFISKTQPFDKRYVVEAEEESCLEDSTHQKQYAISDVDWVLRDHSSAIDTIKLDVNDIEFTFEEVYLNESKCGKVNMKPIEDEFVICPYEKISLAVENLKCSKQNFEWSTGESGSAKIDGVHFQGDYYCTVTYCGNEKVSKFNVTYDDEKTCYEVLYPNALRPDSQNEDEKIFKAYQKNEKEGKVAEYDVFTMKIFNRWGEKVYETHKYSDSWDGTFRGERLPPDVYLYYIHWEVNILKPNGELDKKFEETKEGQVVLLR